MSFTHTGHVRHTGGSNPIEASYAQTSGKESNVSESFADSTTDTLVAFTMDFSQLKMLTILSDQDLQIETNADDATGGQTITLLAGIPYHWIFGSGITNPITNDITALYVTNASGATANLQIMSLEDPTV